MIITTMQEVNALDCGCCPYPGCGDARKECESISVGECNEVMPEHEDVSPEDACKMMSGKVVEWQVDNVDIPSGASWGGVDYTGLGSYGQASTTTWRRAKTGGFCADALVSFEDTIYSNFTGMNEDETLTFISNESGASAWTPPGEFTGSITTVSTVNGVEVQNVTSDYTGDLRNLTPDETWNYVGGYRFEKTVVESPGGGGTITRTYAVTYVPVNIEDLIDELAELEFPDDVNGALCSSGTESDPDCEGSVLSVFKSRYRFAPPAEWFTAWDAWHDGGEVGPEPGTRTTWEMEWDEVFFPKEWDEWNDGGRVGPEPTPGPSLVAERSWEWDGNPANPWSDWYVMAPAAEAGEKRVVNVMIVCWKSSMTGVKPTSSGEVYQFPEP